MTQCPASDSGCGVAPEASCSRAGSYSIGEPGVPDAFLGSAAVLGAEQARTQAKKMLAKVALGEDPQADRLNRKERDALTLRSQVEEFLAIKQTELKPRSFIETKRYLTDPRYFGPLHKMPIDKIVLRDVAARVIAISRESGKPSASQARTM